MTIIPNKSDQKVNSIIVISGLMFRTGTLWFYFTEPLNHVPCTTGGSTAIWKRNHFHATLVLGTTHTSFISAAVSPLWAFWLHICLMTTDITDLACLIFVTKVNIPELPWLKMLSSTPPACYRRQIDNVKWKFKHYIVWGQTPNSSWRDSFFYFKVLELKQIWSLIWTLFSNNLWKGNTKKIHYKSLTSVWCNILMLFF